MANPYRMAEGRALPERRARSEEASAVNTLQSALKGLAEVRAYQSAKDPILAPLVRQAVHQWLTELRYEHELKAVGTKARKKLLLEGPPGTGKTTLAHHLAARLGIPLVVVGPENLVGKYLGDTTGSVARLFDGLREAKTPCVMFMDEIDALGATRDSHGNNSSAGSERKDAMTVMLRKFEEYDGLLIAATNRPKALDTALWRRFDMQLTVDLPEHDERFAILKLYSQPYDLDDDAIDILASLTGGTSPALLESLMLGMKRTLIIGPKMKFPVDDPVAVFAPIIEGLKPPPEMDLPALWNERGVNALADLKTYWPPVVKKDDSSPPE